MFGEPDRDGRRPRFEAVLERVTWWAEVLTVPCVACAESRADAEALAAVGADFVAIGAPLWREAGEIAQAIAVAPRIAEPVR